MKCQLSSHVYPKRFLAPGEVTITGDNIAISLSVSEDGEATEECSAVLSHCHYSRWRDIVTLPEQPCVLHHTFCWVGGGRSCLTSFIKSLKDVWHFHAFCYCLLDQWLVMESRKGGWKAHCMANTFWRSGIVKGWSLQIQRKKAWGELAGSYLDFHPRCFFILPEMLRWGGAHLKEGVKKRD